MPLFGSATPAPPPPLQPFTPSPFVPAALEILPQWICWKAVWRGAKGKWDKLPVSVVTGSGVGFLEARNQVSYDEAIRYAERHGLSGVGFVLMGGDILGIDLDGVRNLATGVIEPWAFDILRRTRTYAEISPSRQGVRLFAIGDLDGKSMIKSSPAKVEMYTAGRYLTFTGDHLPGSPFDVEEDPQTVQALKDRVNKITLLSGTPVPAGTVNSPTNSQAPAPGSDEEFRRYAYGQTFFGKVNKLAMEHLPKWVGELFPAARAYQTGFRVASKDLGRDLEEDISILPTGIVDFGVHDLGDERQGKRTPVDLVVEWLEVEEEGALTPAGAALWLCEKLGVDPSSLGYRGVAVDNGDTSGTAGTELDDVLPGKRQAPPPPPVVDWETAKRGKIRAIQKTIFPGLDRELLTVIGGPSGVLKSTLLMHVAVAIVTERPDILGLTEMDFCGDVLVFANEDPDEITDKRLDAIQKHHGITGFRHKLFTLAGQIFTKLPGKDGRFVWDKTARAQIEDVASQSRAAGRQLAMIAIDTLSSVAAGSEETNREMQEIANLTSTLIRELGSSGLFVHHLRKAGTGDKQEIEPGLDALRGGGAFGNSVRNVLFMARPNIKDRQAARWNEKEAREHVKMRIVKRSYGEEGEPQWFRREPVAVVAVDPRDGSLRSEKYLVMVPEKFDAAAQRARVLKEAYDKIMEANAAGRDLVRLGRANKSGRSVQGLLDLPDKEANEILDELVRKGAVRVEPGKDGQRKLVDKVVGVPGWGLENENEREDDGSGL